MITQCFHFKSSNFFKKNATVYSQSIFDGCMNPYLKKSFIQIISFFFRIIEFNLLPEFNEQLSKLKSPQTANYDVEINFS